MAAGRNPSKGIPWFKHDTGYADDEDIEVLIANHGQDGYAYPLHMYELAYKTRNGELDISEAEKRAVYAKNCLVDLDLWEKITQTALKYGIWDREVYEKRQVLTSNRIKESMRPVLEHREQSKKTYETKNAKSKPANSGAEIPPKKAEIGQSRVEQNRIENKEYVPPPEALRLAGVLAAQILRNNSENRELAEDKKEASLKRWAKAIDLMIRKDNRSPDSIEKVIKWAQNDKFWHKNILSGDTLKDKFDRLILDIAGGGNGKGPGINGRHGEPEYNPDEFEAIEKRRQEDRERKEKAAHGTGRST